MNDHVPVLLNEVIAGLALKDSDIVVDLTLGRGGHSSEILKRIPHGHLYAFDQDITALVEAEPFLKAVGDNYTLIHANFVDFASELNSRGVTRVDKVFGDLGVSSPQFDDGSRGFSYQNDAPLDMRMDQINNKLTAALIVNTYSEKALTEIFYKYAEHSYSPRIAKNIVKHRAVTPITTTGELVEIIKESLPDKELRKKGHPAKTIFQALRIAVNDELGVLAKVIDLSSEVVSVDGRIAFITFHSLEDRIVKQKFKILTSPVRATHPLAMPSDEEAAKFSPITRKPLVATDEENEVNRRARSAKLRIIKKERN